MAATRREVRALCAVLAICAGLLCASHVAAQDPRASLVQETARAWLADTDRNDAAQTWKNAGKQFRDAITVERWAESLKQVRSPLGTPLQRAVLATQFPKSIPGAPNGDYAIVVFRTKFANRAEAHETVTFDHEADGVWRVIGYSIR